MTDIPSTRELITRARSGGRLTKMERVALGNLADAYWTDLCDRCRHRFPCDALLVDEMCEGCIDARARHGF